MSTCHFTIINVSRNLENKNGGTKSGYKERQAKARWKCLFK